MNTGLKDAANLGWKLAATCARRGSGLYGIRRRGLWLIGGNGHGLAHRNLLGS